MEKIYIIYLFSWCWHVWGAWNANTGAKCQWRYIHTILAVADDVHIRNCIAEAILVCRLTILINQYIYR